MHISKKLLAIALCLAMLFLTACNGGSDNTASNSDGNLTSSAVTSSRAPTAQKEQFKYYSTDIWQQLPLVTQEALNMGFKGGEGCQWMTWVTFDPIEGKTAYGGVDVGGLLKSTDGGKSWQQSAIGLKSHGSTGITVDPKNVNRVIAIGCDSYQSTNNGLYLSTDEGISWKQKISVNVHSGRDYRLQVAFDETSYDKSAGYCKTIYWITEDIKDCQKGIYKSTDGGEKWEFIQNSDQYAGSNMVIHPKTGEIYITNKGGLFKSTDGCKTFKNVGVTERISYMCMTRTNPDKIYMTGQDNFYVYDVKSGKAVAQNNRNDGSGYPRYANFIKVSPVDPNKMVLQEDHLSLGNPPSYMAVNYYSDDGGKTWKKSTHDLSGAFMPFNARQNPASFHPTKANVVIKLGGDCIVRSEDGGKTYKMSNDGNNAIYVGGRFNFNVNNTDIFAISSQDYNGGYTIDGGKTWKYLNWAQTGWGGYCYGAYALDENTVVAGLSGEWYNGEVEIVVTHDGGKTITKTGIKTKAATIGIGALGNNKIAFFADYRTTDGGYTWTKMEGCSSVVCIDYKDGRLFGRKGSDVVISEDNGATWSKLTFVGMSPGDMTFNHETQTLYVLAGDLYEYNMNTGKRSMSKSRKRNFGSLCVDPGNPQIMYGIAGGSDSSADCVWRTVDGGQSWHTLNLTLGDGREGTPDGARTADFLRVNKKGEVWISTNCRGMWKMVRPNLNEKK